VRGSLDGGDLFGFGLGVSNLSFGEEHSARAMPKWAERGLSELARAEAAGGTGGEVGRRWAATRRSAEGRAGIPHWQHGRPELGGHRKERQRRSGSTALLEATRKVALIPY
jgi:hypothetical protein